MFLFVFLFFELIVHLYVHVAHKAVAEVCVFVINAHALPDQILADDMIEVRSLPILAIMLTWVLTFLLLFFEWIQEGASISVGRWTVHI